MVDLGSGVADTRGSSSGLVFMKTRGREVDESRGFNEAPNVPRRRPGGLDGVYH